MCLNWAPVVCGCEMCISRTLSPSSGDGVKSNACHSHCMVNIVHGDMNSCATFCCGFRRSRLPCTNRWWVQQELYVEISNRKCPSLAVLQILSRQPGCRPAQSWRGLVVIDRHSNRVDIKLVRHGLFGGGLDRLSVRLDAASGVSARETWRKQTNHQLGIRSAFFNLCFLTFDFCELWLRGSCGFCVAVGFVDASLQDFSIFLFSFLLNSSCHIWNLMFETLKMAFINCAYLCFSVLQKFKKSEDVAFYR